MPRRRTAAQQSRAIAGEFDQPVQPTKQRDAQGIIPLPHGNKAGFVEDFIDLENRPEYKVAFFSQPERYLKDPKPDHMYVWKIAKGGRKHEDTDPHLAMGIRTGKYRPVQIDEIKADADIPMTVMNLFRSSAGNTDVVSVLDLALIELTPRAVAEDYKWRVQQAALRTMDLGGFVEKQVYQKAMTDGVKGLGDMVKFKATEITQE